MSSVEVGAVQDIASKTQAFVPNQVSISLDLLRQCSRRLSLEDIVGILKGETKALETLQLTAFPNKQERFGDGRPGKSKANESLPPPCFPRIFANDALADTLANWIKNQHNQGASRKCLLQIKASLGQIEQNGNEWAILAHTHRWLSHHSQRYQG